MAHAKGQPASNRIDLTGKKFGRLKVIAFAETRGKVAFWRCMCDCGNEKLADGGSLRGGHCESCGCFRSELRTQKNYKHGLRFKKFYGLWVSIRFRCYSERCKDYPDYGGKGIKMCKAWVNDPVAFVEWATKQPKPDPLLGRYMIDRKNGKLGYSPSNCRFVTDPVSVRNRSMTVWVTIKGDRLPYKDAVTKYGKVSYGIVKKRVREGWSRIDAILTPPRQPKP